MLNGIRLKSTPWDQKKSVDFKQGLLNPFPGRLSLFEIVLRILLKLIRNSIADNPALLFVI